MPGIFVALLGFHTVLLGGTSNNNAISGRAGNSAVLTFVLTSGRMKIPHKSFFLLHRAPRLTVRVGFVLFCIFVLTSLIHAQGTSVEGRSVMQVRVVDQSGKEVTEKVPTLALQNGKPFDFSDERESLRELYQTGDYSDIRVVATPQSGGLRVDFVVTRNFFNNVIRIEGLQSPPSEPAAIASLRLNLGEPFRESALREAVERLQGTLRADGFYETKITWTLVPHEATRQMDVTINLDSGTRARVGNITLDNKTPYPDQEVLKRTKIPPGKQVTAARLSQGSEKIRKYLVNQGYLGAGAVITAGTYDPQSDLVPLRIAVTAGPRVRVEITGARISKGKRRTLLPIFAEGAVDDDLLQEGRRNIRDYLQSQGYFSADVQVSSQQDSQEKEQVITYTATRGDHFRLAGVGFDGNKYFRSSLLGRRLQLLPASFASSGRFSQQLMRDDTDSIRALYLSNGFRDVQVTSQVDDRYEDKKNNLFVSFHIMEGAQTLITGLQIEGNQAISIGDLISVSGSTAASRIRIRSFY